MVRFWGDCGLVLALAIVSFLDCVRNYLVNFLCLNRLNCLLSDHIHLGVCLLDSFLGPFLLNFRLCLVLQWLRAFLFCLNNFTSLLSRGCSCFNRFSCLLRQLLRYSDLGNLVLQFTLFFRQGSLTLLLVGFIDWNSSRRLF